MTNIRIDDLDTSYCVQDTGKPNEKVFWATIPAMKGLYNMAWVLRDHLADKSGLMANKERALMEELVELTRAALRKERGVATVPGNGFVEESTVIVGFEVNMSYLLLITDTLRVLKTKYGQNLLHRFEGYLCLLECTMKEARRHHFSAESA